MGYEWFVPRCAADLQAGAEEGADYDAVRDLLPLNAFEAVWNLDDAIPFS